VNKKKTTANSFDDPVIAAIFEKHGGIQLDIGCGYNKEPGWVGMDIQDLPGVDIVWDFNIHPFPLPDESVILAKCVHVIEHIPPVMIDPDRGTWFPFIEFMNEVWRILKPRHLFVIQVPFGMSQGYYQDPTHVNIINENTWRYFDPLEAETGGGLYGFYRPAPWEIKACAANSIGNIEVLLRKRLWDKTYLAPQPEQPELPTEEIENE
jgi:hypothetical protein